MRDKNVRVRVMIAFGDISGFSAYTQQINDDEGEFNPFMDRFDQMVADLERDLGGEFVKYMGDGFLAVVEIPTRSQSRRAAEFLAILISFQRRMTALIRRTRFPRPTGFRVRLSAGQVWKKEGQSGRRDYRGRHINLAHKLLGVEKGIGVMCHESFLQLSTPEKLSTAGLRRRHVVTLQKPPDGVYKSDMSALWEIKQGGR